MKIRKGFVSNSSSSSFICDVSGEVQSGWDLLLSDAEMYKCEMGHIFCEDYIVKDAYEKYCKENEENEDFDDRYDLPKECCPICSFKYIMDKQAVLFLLKKCNVTMEDIEKEIKDTFKDYKEFSYSLKD